MAYDYAKHLHMGAVDCFGIISDTVGQYIVSESSAEIPEMETCEYLNVSLCPATETNNVSI